MLTPTPAGAAWPVRLAYCAAAIFTLASAGTNLNYGISKGTDAASSTVWAAVSVAVSIVFALSWPALIKAVERRQWTWVPMAAAALVLTGAYSVTADGPGAIGDEARHLPHPAFDLAPLTGRPFSALAVARSAALEESQHAGGGH